MPSTVYYLPDTLRNWPWKELILNPHYREAQNESFAWLEGFCRLTPAARKALYKGAFDLFCAQVYPKATLYNLRSCCDLMHTFFALDDETDSVDGAQARVLCDIAMDAVENPDKPRPEEESIIGEITRQFWQRASAQAPKAARERFVKSWNLYLGSVVQQAERRPASYICSMDEYMASRRLNIGCDPSFVLLEISLDLDLHHEVMEHPAIVSVNSDAQDMVILWNDMVSYKKEVLTNSADYNIVTIITSNCQTDIAGAIKWISHRNDELVGRFLETKEDILNHRNGVPSWGEDIDIQVAKYIDGLGKLCPSLSC
ncbi:isoprenoid synthase domain-containing protein [Mycena albidolilacea]|uniref:Terpene synthase n=1 Tax=Mycena albidolilacea TaxID=1033008 RepID=A0AAD6YYK0_9AGAR|nr:isoprenoid synthase domain-containing protein [Mycena albidolilacea]